MYIWEVLCQIWPIGLLMGMVAIPILWIWFEEDNQYESLDDHYSKEDVNDESNI